MNCSGATIPPISVERTFGSSGAVDQPEIDMIRNWGDRKLGDNARAGEELVLLLRGELLRRYPNSVIYAVAAVRTDGAARPVAQSG